MGALWVPNEDAVVNEGAGAGGWRVRVRVVDGSAKDAAVRATLVADAAEDLVVAGLVLESRG